MKEKFLLGLLFLMLILLFAAEVTNGQTIVDNIKIKPETQITLDFKYNLPQGAAFNDILSFSGEVLWSESNGYSMVYIPSSVKFAPVWENFLNFSNETDIEFHKLSVASAGVIPVKADKDTTFISMDFISPSTFEPVVVIVTGFFKVNESDTEYVHSYVITVDPNLGVGNDKPHKFVTNYTAELFPNPAVDGVNVQMDIELPQPINAVVYDVYGRIVKTIYNGVANPDQLLSFSVDELAAGTYFTRLSTKHKQIVIPFTVQR